jgi:hypothetical protein
LDLGFKSKELRDRRQQDDTETGRDGDAAKKTERNQRSEVGSQRAKTKDQSVSTTGYWLLTTEFLPCAFSP